MRILANSFQEDLNLFLKNYALYICLGFVALILIVFIIVVVCKNKTNGKVKKEEQPITQDEWFTALGGKENVQEVVATGSRLSVTLVDKEKINREQLTSLGVTNVMIMSNKLILVIEDKAEAIAKQLNQ